MRFYYYLQELFSDPFKSVQFLFFVFWAIILLLLPISYAFAWQQQVQLRFTHPTATEFIVYVDYGSGADTTVRTGGLESSGGIFNYAVSIDRLRKCSITVTAWKNGMESVKSNSKFLKAIPAPTTTLAPTTTTTVTTTSTVTTTTFPVAPILLEAVPWLN